MHRAPSPYRAPSSYAPHPVEAQYNGLPTGTAQVGPGAMTYTISAGPDGRPIYQPFKAVAASYQTLTGILSGIQWIPGEPTTVRPSGPQYDHSSGTDPRGWQGTGYASSYKDDYKAGPDWQRADEKRRKQEDKEAKRHREQDGSNDSEYELRLARERDGQSSVNRDRRKSFNSGNAHPPGSVAFPVTGGSSGYPTHPSVAAGYPSSPYSNYAPSQPPGAPAYPMGPSTHSRNPSGSYSDITRQFQDMDLDRNKEHGERNRKISGGVGRPRKYSTSDNTYERTRTTSGNYADRSKNPYPSPPGTTYEPYSISVHPSTYANPYPPSHYTSHSPNIHAPDISSFGTANSTGYPGSNYTSSPARNVDHIARSTTPFGAPPPQVYPRSHSLEGQPIGKNNHPRSRVPSRAGSPNLATFPKPNASPRKSPHMPVASIPEQHQLPAPEAFKRPFNASNSFVPFDMVKIQDLDEIYDPKYPKMPRALSTYDVYPEDWIRCMQDLGRCWSGQLPVGVGKDGQPPRRSTLAKDLVHVWNINFFFRRGVELILYKGRDRRTGPQAGQIEVQLPPYDDADEFSSSSPSSDSDRSGYGNRMIDAYGRPMVGNDPQEARRRHQEEKQEKRRRRKEEKARRKARARDKSYTAYIACLPRGPAVPYGARPPSMAQGGYGPNPGAAAPYGTPAYGAPVGIPTTRSHGYGSGY